MKKNKTIKQMVNGLILISLSSVAIAAQPKFILAASTPTQFSLAKTTETEVRYTVFNNTGIDRVLAMKPIEGVEQMTTGGSGVCGATFSLLKNQGNFCELILKIKPTAQQTVGTTISGGPEVCAVVNGAPSPFLCSQPSKNEALKIEISAWQNISATENQQPWPIAFQAIARPVIALPGSDTVYAATYSTGNYIFINKSTDGGVTWKQINQTIIPGGQSWAMAIDPSNPKILYLGTGNGVWKSQDGGVTWEPRSQGLPYQFNSVGDIKIDSRNPQHLYAALFGSDNNNAGGLYQSLNAGASWTPLLGNNPALKNKNIFTITLHPTDPKTLMIGSENLSQTNSTGYWDNPAAFKSTDGGHTWVAANQGLPAIYGRVPSIVIDSLNPSDCYILLRESVSYTNSQTNRTYYKGQVYQSHDGCLTWNSTPLATLSATPEFRTDRGYSMIENPTNPNELMVGGTRGVYRLDKTTGVLTKMTMDSTDPNKTAYTMTWPKADSFVVGAVYPSNSNLIMQSSTQGNTWVAGQLPAYLYANVGALNVPAAHTVLASYQNGSYAESTGDPIAAKGLLKTADAGITWTNLNNAAIENIDADNAALRVITQIYSAANPSVLFILNNNLDGFGTNQGVLTSGDNGTSWTVATPAETLSSFVMAPSTPSVLYGVGENTDVDTLFMKSTNSGNSWSSVFTYPVANKINLGGLVVDNRDANVIYLWKSTATENQLIQSMDGGQTWSEPLLTSTLYAGALSQSSVNPDVWYLASQEGVRRSEDNGQTWTLFTQGLPLDYWPVGGAVVVDPHNGNHLFVAYYGQGVFESLNNGQSWAPFNSGLTDKSIESMTIDPNTSTLYVGTFIEGVFQAVL